MFCSPRLSERLILAGDPRTSERRHRRVESAETLHQEGEFPACGGRHPANAQNKRAQSKSVVRCSRALKMPALPTTRRVTPSVQLKGKNGIFLFDSVNDYKRSCTISRQMWSHRLFFPIRPVNAGRGCASFSCWRASCFCSAACFLSKRFLSLRKC